MLVFSHRGLHVALPENTCAAFQAAVELGVDGIETDIRLSACGQAILFHDRHSPDGRAVAEMTRDELAAVMDHEIPTLDEVLARWPEIIWNVEIKVPEAVELTSEILNRQTLARRPLVSSFWHTVVDRMRRLPQVDCGVLVAHSPLDLSLLERGWTPGLPPVRTIVWKYDTVDPRLTALARAAGVTNLAYDVITPEEHAAAESLGLDGLITDRPDYLLPRNARSSIDAA